MGQIENILKPLVGYFATLKRNAVEGWYELEIGLPSNWNYKSNNTIDCEVLEETKAGKLILIKPKRAKVTADDLVEYAEIIIKTNEEIAKSEKLFEEKMRKVKEDLEKEVNKFYEDLEKKRKDSFENFGKTTIPKSKTTEVDEEVKSNVNRRGRPAKKKTENVEEEKTE